MKRILFFLLAITNIALAQNPITLTSADMPTAGWTQRRAMDTLPLPTVNTGLAGANRTWDFSNLVVTKYDTVRYLTLTGSQSSNFPTADVAITTDGASFLYTKTSANKYTLEGIEGNLSGAQTTANFSPVEDVFRFPTQYGGTYSSTWGFQKTVPGSAVGQPVSDVRVTFTATDWDTIDGWGKTITPIGAYKSLRQARKETARTIIEYRLFSFSPWTQLSDRTTTTLHYTYLAKETKGALVQLEYDSLDNLKDVRYSMILPAAPVASFTDASGGAGLVTFTDATDGYPTSYSWTFGDGGTSSQQSPNHVYTANGTYYVCLTVTNNGGSNTYCDSVHVTSISAATNNPPAAVNDSFDVVQAQSGIVHVAGNDVDVDGDNICLTEVWGSPYATEYIGGTCDMIMYAPDTLFTGLDTAWYKLCDDGTPVKCDTGMVVFNVMVDPNLYPVAVNDAASTQQPAGITVNAGGNDQSGTGNTLCITAVSGSPHSSYFTINSTTCTMIDYTPDSTFTGADTCWYVICDNGFPTLCDTGMVVVTSTANNALLPVASFSPDISDCNIASAYNSAMVVNTSANATSIAWSFTAFSGCDSSRTFSGDTVTYSADQLFQSCSYYERLKVCLTATNSYGSSTFCDTTCMLVWEGINETALANIRLYPNPAGNVVTINMQNNSDPITQNYSAIELYNVLGEKVKATGPQGKTVQLNIANLPQGTYLALITTATGERRTLGRVVKE